MFDQQIQHYPQIADRDAADRLVESLGNIYEELPPSVQRLLYAVGSVSPYLSRLLINQSAQLRDLFSREVEGVVADCCALARAAVAEESADAEMAALRKARHPAALMIALAEIGGVRSTMECAALWSDFADAALEGALKCALQPQIALGFAPADPHNLCTECGVAIVAMGKLGARELNYSSDIDVIVIYDPQAAALGAETARKIAVSVTRQLCGFLQEQTADGYVFRTDLRLRPDPGVSAPAVSIEMAEQYYEAYGQNWERAAFIKARIAAGDDGLGERFLRMLRPFIWRRYLDFAAIEDVRSIARQIHAVKGGGEITFLGHDVKVGRGGIREIEFLVQTQQLILGGKDPSLRSRETLAALQALSDGGYFGEEEAVQLKQHYIYLRCIEHRIQMINDEQTHKIPSAEEGAARLAAFMGEQSLADLEQRVRGVLAEVHSQFAQFFEQEERLSAGGGNLSFTGVEDDPDTIASLSGMGFVRAGDVAATLRKWHGGGVAATRTGRARELLTALTPRLLETLAASSDPDEAFQAFADFVMSLPAGVQIFSLFANSPTVFTRVVQLMTLSPYWGRELAKRHRLVEALLDHDWPDGAPDMARLEQSLAAQMTPGMVLEDAMNAVRRWVGAERFQIAAQLILGTLDAQEAARGFSDVADLAIRELLGAVEVEMCRRHGTIDGAVGVLALGRLGERQMTATSDIDLVFIYQTEPDSQSDGPKPLDGATYYFRLVRMLVTALSVPTEEGGLYEVDMKLRPSGGAGPAAVSFSAFEKYHDEEAWTFEHMALTKARIVAGGGMLRQRIERKIDAIIARPRDPKALARDVAEMRERIIAAKPSRSCWDLKSRPGGIVDLDFTKEYTQLREGRRLDWPAIAKALASQADHANLAWLVDAAVFYEKVIQYSRATTGGIFDPDQSGKALSEAMALQGEATSIEELQQRLLRMQKDISTLFTRIVVGGGDENGQ